MKRFVIVTNGDLNVQKIVECETTLQAQAECEKAAKAGFKAVWIKAESIEDVAERDPYVKIKLLLDQVKALHDAMPDEGPEEPVAKTDTPRKWSNGRTRVTK